MAETSDPRVAVYLDFDNIVMSWYDRVHGRNAYSRDRQRIAQDITDPEIAEKLAAATVDVGAIIDYAASFGSLMLTRAYADWSSPLNADYRTQLVARAVDLVQLFPAAAYAKNGADIRLAVDTVEDMFRIPDLTHVVIVGGDSDYVPLAQRCRRLGRYVIGMGVTGSTAKSLAAACDEFEAYDQLPGVTRPDSADSSRSRGGRGSGKGKGRSTKNSSGTSDEHTDPVDEPSGAVVDPEETAEDPQETASRLLQRALQLGDRGDGDWLHSSAVKTHMRRMDPSFSEKALGYKSFSDFLKANSDIAQLEETGHERLVRSTE
ncbi:NYN domain-containing protein [Brachybacterium sp. p3-SID1565]|uniref:NYN domain-containing protein n=1 Tax=Brachybacterium epidermidis TaxID=2781983 RepID=A0ABR9VXX9_9MICO|nr:MULTISPECIES: NYN domain-containing protein [Brachybacterium]MBE9403037.1 NYN domain-containing protein [Brachybacterium epidermidis]MCT1384333.1 NYN domain-containing protein [Brachybacterium sp. p3-SID1565]MCT1774640.1 NYN domain-containing protein [Brachybacterium sp. p3-SID957]